MRSSGARRRPAFAPWLPGSARPIATTTSGSRAATPWSMTSTSPSARSAAKEKPMAETTLAGAVPVEAKPSHGVSWGEAFRVWLRVAALSFGGPAGQIAVMHRILVEEKRWISEERFLHALNYCMLLPGPEAQQLATYVGWLMHRTVGGIMAGGLFVVPSIFVLWTLSFVYAAYGTVPWIAAIFYGLKPVVVAIVVAAVIRIGKKALKNDV